MTAVFAFASYLGTLVVLAVVCFGFGRYDQKFGPEGSFLVMAVVFSIFLPSAALGFHLARRKFSHARRAVAIAGFGAGLLTPLVVLLLDWVLSSRLIIYGVPILGIFLAGFATARLTESNVASADPG